MRPIIVLLALSVSSAPLAAQRTAEPGDRLRLLTAHGRQVAIGTFVGMAGDTVILSDTAGASERVPLFQGVRWQVSEGAHRNVLGGMGVGLLVGATIGAAIGFMTYSPSTCTEWCFFDFDRGDTTVLGAIVVGVPSTVIGGLVGLIKRERWERVSASVSPDLSPSATSRTTLGLSIRF